MKFILIILATYHFEAGGMQTQTQFETLALCNKAKSEITEAFYAESARMKWGRQGITAMCVQVKEKP